MGGTLSSLELWRDGEIYLNYFGNSFQNALGVWNVWIYNVGNEVVVGHTYSFKVRVKDSLGNYSAFSEILNVTAQ